MIKTYLQSVTAFAPATCANVAVGFDILGFALDEVGDYVSLSKRDDNKIIVESISGNTQIPLNADENTAGMGIKHLCRDLQIQQGFSIRIKKGIPLCSGMGGSAASAVAALVACNAFLHSPLPPTKLIQYALLAEGAVSGGPHADNIVPALLGGLTLVHSLNPLSIVSLPVPDLYCAYVYPHVQVATKEARKILKSQVDLKTHTAYAANLAVFIAALYQQDISLLKASFKDVLIEPQRAHLLPGFYQIQKKALEAGALGMSFSGSGPSLFAFAQDEKEAQTINRAISTQLKTENILSDSWVFKMNKQGASLTREWS